VIPLPVHLFDLTPDHLREVTQVHAYDPSTDNTGMLLSIPGRGWMTPGPERVLTVYINKGRAAADLTAIRGIIETAAGRAPSVPTQLLNGAAPPAES
jgi:hypothetical protein